MMTSEASTEPTTDAELYAKYSHALVAFATSIVGPSMAADVVHDAAVSLVSSQALARAHDPRALLYKAVFAKAKSAQRSAFRRRDRERRFAATIVTHDPEVLPEVAIAVAKLSPQQRACVFLTYWEDMTPQTVGDFLGISDGTVKHHLARARKRLRETLDQGDTA
ncbi:MAG: sigma-70 family RNA polymerase sigma factor [Actinobacteria bacterium]|nr:sigma-70 family RNA polymerase sigma factor [Actinomycetota bacterium]